MTKRFGALALAAALPLSALVATSASAQQAPPGDRPCRGEYSNGKPFRLTAGGAERANGQDFALSHKAGNGRKGETAMRVTKGAQILLSARLVQVDGRNAQGLENQKPCPGERVSLHVRKAGEGSFRVVNADSLVTLPLGRVEHRMTADKDFRFFGNFNKSATEFGARTATVLVQTKP